MARIVVFFGAKHATAKPFRPQKLFVDRLNAVRTFHLDQALSLLPEQFAIFKRVRVNTTSTGGVEWERGGRLCRLLNPRAPDRACRLDSDRG